LREHDPQAEPQVRISIGALQGACLMGWGVHS
jgi:hypothetical protein